MNNTAGDRVKQWREFKGLSAGNFASLTGLKYSTLKSLEAGGQPSYETMQKLRLAFPDLNTEWLLDDTGTAPMLRDGRALAPAQSAAPALLHSGAATVAEAENILLREQVADLKSDKVRLLQENEQLRGKSSDNPDAAGSQPAAPSKPKPGVIGFRLAVSRRAGNRGKAAPAGLS